MQLPALEFIRRFLLHVLPLGLQLLSNRVRGSRLTVCRQLLNAVPTRDARSAPELHYRDRYAKLTGRSLHDGPPVHARAHALHRTPATQRGAASTTGASHMNPDPRPNESGSGIPYRDRSTRSAKCRPPSSGAPRVAFSSIAFRALSFPKPDRDTFVLGAANPVVSNIARGSLDPMPIAASRSGAV
jgi:hypothetical protein